MGYDIYIGEAEIAQWGTDEESTALRVRVKRIERDGAPEFPGDGMTGKGNSRHPSYTAWSEFAKRVGLYDLFFGKDELPGLMTEHPGCFRLTRRHEEQIAAALDRYRAANPDKVPGWDPNLQGMAAFTGNGADPKYDGDLARLMWLVWWVRWALDNCKTPAIYNH